MKFNEIYLPIDKELRQVETELKNVMEKLGGTSTRDIFNYFFSIPGKRLRPTLTLLSAGAVNNQLQPTINYELIELAVAVELIHSASLIHDDIIDGDLMRRGQKTLNKTFGNKIAVLVGDALYSRAFSIFSNSLSKEFSEAMGKVTEKMCIAEILNAKNTLPDRETYLKIIEGKTAYFMSICCSLGATIANASEKEISSLASYGLNLGMAYQILDDYIDNDAVAIKNVTLEEAFQFAFNAKNSIKTLEDSSYKKNLINLVDYVLDFYKPEVQSI